MLMLDVVSGSLQSVWVSCACMNEFVVCGMTQHSNSCTSFYGFINKQNNSKQIKGFSLLFLLDVSVLGCFSRSQSVLTFGFSACSRSTCSATGV